MTSSMVIIPTASSSSGIFGSGLPSISRMSEYMFFVHFLLLVPLNESLPLLGKLFHFFSGLFVFTLLSTEFFSPSMSTLTSLTESTHDSNERRFITQKVHIEFCQVITKELTVYMCLASRFVHHIPYNNSHVTVTLLEFVQDVV